MRRNVIPINTSHVRKHHNIPQVIKLSPKTNKKYNFLPTIFKTTTTNSLTNKTCCRDTSRTSTCTVHIFRGQNSTRAGVKTIFKTVVRAAVLPYREILYWESADKGWRGFVAFEIVIVWVHGCTWITQVSVYSIWNDTCCDWCTMTLDNMPWNSSSWFRFWSN